MFLNYSISLKALDRYVQGYNKKQQSVKTKVRTAMIYTAKELLKIYGVSLRKDAMVAPVTLEHIPGLRTNNAQLATLTQGCKRTIQRHIKRLEQAGIITHKIGHGSNASYELFIHPDILQLQEVPIPPKQKAETQREATASKYPDKSKTPAEYPEKKETPTEYPEKSKTPVKTTGLESVRQGIERLQQAWKNKGTPQKEDAFVQKATAPTEQNSTTKENPTVEENNQRSLQIIHYSTELWRVARDKLYQDALLTPEQGIIAKRLLYQWYDPVATSKLEALHQVYLRRIDLVAKYFKKDPDRRFVQLPYLYFDPNNSNGFAGTRQWYFQERERKEKTRLELILAQQIRKYKRNETMDASNRRPRITVFRECEQRIGKLKQPQLLQKFYTAVLQYQKSET